MPQLKRLDDFPYVPQEEDSMDCVPACVAMAMEYLGAERDIDDLRTELECYSETGTPFENVALVSRADVIFVGSRRVVEEQLELDRPVVASIAVDDAEVLGYFPGRPFLHAVVLVGIDDASVLFFDPLSAAERSTHLERECGRAVFEAAWLEGRVILPR